MSAGVEEDRGRVRARQDLAEREQPGTLTRSGFCVRFGAGDRLT